VADGAGPGWDADLSASCTGCGWSGTGGGLRESGPGDIEGGPLGGACPRCGMPVAPDPPTVAEIIAVRRTREPGSPPPDPRDPPA
jgi:hypothetical protein